MHTATRPGAGLFSGFGGFRYRTALACEAGVSRRDPSPVVCADGRYHAWYTRSTHDPSGYQATIWHATSADGVHWEERGEALARGGRGAFDEHAVFTPTVMVAEGRYWLFYTAVPEPFDNAGGGPGGTQTRIGVASAAHPDGPWDRAGPDPILEPSTIAERFDSHRVDDSCLVRWGREYRLYYKGRQLGLAPNQTTMGLAVAARPEGPYTRHPANPVLDSGHEVCVWPHGAGLGCIVAPCGPRGGTLQYSADGVRFQRVRAIEPPRAPGPYRQDRWRDSSGPGIAWGLCQNTTSPWPWLQRFDANLRHLA